MNRCGLVGGRGDIMGRVELKCIRMVIFCELFFLVIFMVIFMF